jgi:hypothetical protein
MGAIAVSQAQFAYRNRKTGQVVCEIESTSEESGSTVALRMVLPDGHDPGAWEAGVVVHGKIHPVNPFSIPDDAEE